MSVYWVKYLNASEWCRLDPSTAVLVLVLMLRPLAIVLRGWDTTVLVPSLVVVCYYSRLYQLAKLFLFAPSSGYYSCPLAMTDGAAKSIEVAACLPYKSVVVVSFTQGKTVLCCRLLYQLHSKCDATFGSFLTGVFSRDDRLAGGLNVPTWRLLVQDFLQARCHSCHQTNNVRTVK